MKKLEHSVARRTHARWPQWRITTAALMIASTACLMAACGGSESTVLASGSGAVKGQAGTFDPSSFPEGISTKDGRLVFKDQQQFDDTVLKMLAMKKEQLDAWFTQHPGYTSMTEAFASVSHKADAYLADVEKRPASASEMDVKAFMYQLANQNKNVAHVEEGEDGRSLERNISHPGLSLLVNKDGLVEIKGKIYHYLKDGVRSEFSDASRLRLLAQSPCVTGAGSISSAEETCGSENSTHAAKIALPSDPTGENDGYTLFRIEPRNVHVPEGGVMVFRVKRIQVNPNPTNKRESYYGFRLLDSLDTASLADLGLRSVSGNARFVKINSQTVIQVDAGTEEFDFSIAIPEDYKAEDVETITITIGSMRSLPGIVPANSVPECTTCQNWDVEHQATVKKDKIKIRDTLIQQRRGDKIYTLHTVYLHSQKRVLGNWNNEKTNIALDARVIGNKRVNYQNWVDGWYDLNSLLIESWDDPWDIPHVDSAVIRGIRTGGEHGVTVTVYH